MVNPEIYGEGDILAGFQLIKLKFINTWRTDGEFSSLKRAVLFSHIDSKVIYSLLSLLVLKR